MPRGRPKSKPERTHKRTDSTPEATESTKETPHAKRVTVARLANWLFPYGICQLMGVFLILASLYSMANGFAILSGNSIFTTLTYTITQTEISTSSVYTSQPTTSVSIMSCATHPCTLTAVISDTIAVNEALRAYLSKTQVSSYNAALDFFAMLCGLVLLLIRKLPTSKLPTSKSGLLVKKTTLRDVLTLIMSALVGAEVDKMLPTYAWWTHLIAVGMILVFAIGIFSKLD
jgi:hypothetical protein